MRVAGRALLALLFGSIFLIALFALREPIAGARDALWSDATAAEVSKASIVYALRREPTQFVFSNPQQRVRILTNASVTLAGPRPYYSYEVNAYDSKGRYVSGRTVHLASTRSYVRGDTGRTIPAAFTSGQASTIPSAGDETLLQFDRPISRLTLKVKAVGPGVQGIFARVQEQRPLSKRQLEVGWHRLSAVEKEELASGNPLEPELLTEEEKQGLLLNKWYPVGPAGTPGSDYHQVTLHERSGIKFSAPE